MRQIAVVMGAALLAGCGKKDAPPAADSTAASAPAPISLADVAGKWDVQVTLEASDSTVTSYQLTATADTAGWFMSFPDRDPIPLRVVAVDGDSIVVDAGPYASILRAGVQVSTRTVLRFRNNRLNGSTVAHYVTSSADSVVNLRSRGRRAQ